MKFVALQKFSPDGLKQYKAGDVLEMSEYDAQVLLLTKLVKPVDEDEPMKRGSYKRRDLRAEK